MLRNAGYAHEAETSPPRVVQHSKWSGSVALGIINRLRQNGHEAYLVGGCVRDRLLGRRIKDLDVATSAKPDQVMALFPSAKAVGASFGVVLVPEGQAGVEVATYRTDHDYHDGRHPATVEFTATVEDDVRRRDFTINGMLQDPISGDVLDFVGGRGDLDRRLIRAIGEPGRRFAEDKLRMLRAVRFAARLSFRIEDETLAAIQTHAQEIEQIAPERIREELNRILTEGGARRGFELLDQSGLLECVLPEVAAMQGVEQPPQFHPEGDVWTHTLMMLEGLREPTATLGWGTLLHDVGKPGTFTETDRIRFNGHVALGVEITARICSRLRFSNADSEQISALVANHMKFMEITRMRPAKLKRFLWQQEFDEHLELHRQDCLSSHGSLANYEFARKKLEDLEKEQPQPPAPLITGEDLKAAGYKPGPLFGEILSMVEEEHLDGNLSDRDSAMEFVLERFKRLG